MNYEGEFLLPGQLGNFFIILSLISPAVACFVYFLSTRYHTDHEKNKWIRIARFAFFIDVLSVICVFGILLFIINNHLFEYEYVWQHSSKSLEAKYLFASIWEGQEGSFLLWSFWHCILGLIIIKKSKNWEPTVMTVICFAQFCLATMVAGFKVFGTKIGSNPFSLLRDVFDAPLFSRADYLSFIKDGNDLNPLLQNYWMIIHPPVLFLGFASTIIPFAYAVAGLWTKRYKEWIKPAIAWTLFSAAALGLGLIMGSMWAYESLTFGGYWAWDPVENASLVPWLTLVSGAHVLVISQKTNRYLRFSFFIIIVSFLLILYSTFLTRSGILGDTSVHAFTDLGMNFQLLLFLLVFTVPSLLLYFFRYRNISHLENEEHFSSREFWIFIGSVILLISAASIIMMTSIPVINKLAEVILNTDSTLFKPLAIGENSEYSYNRIQIIIAIAIGILSGFAQYLKYKKTAIRYFYSKILWPLIISLLIGILFILIGDFNYKKYGIGYNILIWIALFSGIFAIITNLNYIIYSLKGKLKSAGASVSHVGFGVMLLGILISSSKKEILSYDTTSLISPVSDRNSAAPGENLTLIRDSRASMHNYWVTYIDQTTHASKPLQYYKILFEKKDGSNEFVLTPNAFVNYKDEQGIISNPDAKHSWNQDIFAYVTSIPAPQKDTDTVGFIEKSLMAGDSISIRDGHLILDKLITKNDIDHLLPEPNSIASMATLNLISDSLNTYIAEPLLVRRGERSYILADTIYEKGLIIQLINVKDQKAEIRFKQINIPIDYVTLKVYSFPFINFYWIGALLIILGFFIAIIYRIRVNKQQT